MITNFISTLFSSDGFLPHVHCYLDRSGVVWLHFVSDLLIGSAYFVISLTLYLLIRRIRLPFNFMFVSFGVFIGACGLTHFMEVWTLWHPTYWLAGAIKAVTALASVSTGIFLVRTTPEVIKLSEVAKLAEESRNELQRRTVQLTEAQHTLKQTNELLEVRVAERTEELAKVNDRLQRQIEQQKSMQQALEKSEEQFRHLTESMPQIVWIGAEDGKVLYYNSQWYNYTGQNPENHDGEEWPQVIHPDDLPRVQEAMAESIKAGQISQVEFRLRSKSGNYRWFLSRSKPIRNASGKVYQWFGTSTDIHDQKQALELRDEFISIASHELKTPLTSIKLQNQLAARALSKSDSIPPGLQNVQTLVDVTSRQLDKLERLIDDMLDVSRMQTGRFSVDRQRVDLAELLKEVAGHFSQTARPSVHLELEIGEGTFFGNFDRFRIEQVVNNLLSNALKYGQGKPIRVRMYRHDDGWAELSVQDFGIGIPREHQARIFEKFERAVHANSISGLGLGLSIASEILKAHGGSIQVTSEPGQGSTFKVSLPIEPQT